MERRDPMISVEPLLAMLRRRLGLRLPDLTERALESWEISPGAEVEVPPALALPGMAERIRATVFASLPDVLRAFAGTPAQWHGPTRGFLLRDVTLHDGRLAARGAEAHLRPRQGLPFHGRLPDLGSAALYETWVGNRWFGNWLADNCLTHGLALASGRPVLATAAAKPPHGPDYQALYGMAPRLAAAGHFDELVLFDDLPDNPGKRARAAALRARLMAQVPEPVPCPGVMLLRGESGDRRMLQNEMALAETLAAHGFLVLDPMREPAARLAQVLAGAAVAVGIEGSQMVHALVTLPPGATIVAIQPPDRTCATLKSLGERLQLRFGYVVAEGSAGQYRVEAAEVLRTLDLRR